MRYLFGALGFMVAMLCGAPGYLLWAVGAVLYLTLSRKPHRWLDERRVTFSADSEPAPECDPLADQPVCCEFHAIVRGQR